MSRSTDFLVDKLSDTERLGALATAVAVLERDFRRLAGALGRGESLSADHRRYRAAVRRRQSPAFRSDSLPPNGRSGIVRLIEPRSTRKIYGSVGNSFVAAVEFGTTGAREGPSMSGGESAIRPRLHFTDQPTCIPGVDSATSVLPEDVSAHAERTYHPGIRSRWRRNSIVAKAICPLYYISQFESCLGQRKAERDWCNFCSAPAGMER